jgi:excisionase family DNA binding protein
LLESLVAAEVARQLSALRDELVTNRVEAVNAPWPRVDGLLAIPEAAACLGVAAATVRDLRVDRTGPKAIKVGRLVKFRTDDLEQFVSDAAEPANQ